MISLKEGYMKECNGGGEQYVTIIRGGASAALCNNIMELRH